MTAPGEHKTVQARILAYAQEIGWRYVSRAEAERRRGFAPHPDPLPEDGARGIAERAQKASLFFGDLLHSQVRAFNPMYKEAEGALIGKGYRREDAKEKKSTMDVYWIPGVNNLKTYGRWAFAEFTEVYQIEADFKAKVESEFDKMIAKATQP